MRNMSKNRSDSMSTPSSTFVQMTSDINKKYQQQ